MNDPRIHRLKSDGRVVPIAEMHPNHLYNAIISECQDWLTKLKEQTTLDDFESVLKSPPATDVHVLSLLEEIKQRP